MIGSYVTNDSSRTHACGYGYPSTCSRDYSSLLSTPLMINKITSYRGKPKYVGAEETSDGTDWVANVRTEPKNGYVRAYNAYNRQYGRYPNKECYLLYCNGSQRVYWEGGPWFDIYHNPSAHTGIPEYVYIEKLMEFGANQRDYVIRDLYAKANSPRFNTAIFVAELGETLTGIKDLLKFAGKAFFRPSTQMKAAASLSKEPEGIWMWYRYALMPAILSINDVLEAMEKPTPVTKVRDGKKTALKLKGHLIGPVWWKWANPAQFNYDWKTDLSAGCGGALDIVSKDDPAPWGTGPVDVIAMFYEKARLSFVLNWLIGFEQWLNSLRPAGVEILQSYSTYAVNATTTFEEKGSGTLYGDATIKLFVTDRITDLQVPILPKIDPQWANCLRTVDAISLIIGMLKGILNKKHKRIN